MRSSPSVLCSVSLFMKRCWIQWFPPQFAVDEGETRRVFKCDVPAWSKGHRCGFLRWFFCCRLLDLLRWVPGPPKPYDSVQEEITSKAMQLSNWQKAHWLLTHQNKSKFPLAPFRAHLLGQDAVVSVLREKYRSLLPSPTSWVQFMGHNPVESENQFPQVALWSPHANCVVYEPRHRPNQ